MNYAISLFSRPAFTCSPRVCVLPINSFIHFFSFVPTEKSLPPARYNTLLIPRDRQIANEEKENARADPLDGTELRVAQKAPRHTGGRKVGSLCFRIEQFPTTILIFRPLVTEKKPPPNEAAQRSRYVLSSALRPLPPSEDARYRTECYLRKSQCTACYLRHKWRRGRYKKRAR